MSTTNDSSDDRYRPLGPDEMKAPLQAAANDNWELAGPCPDGTPIPTISIGNRAADESWPFHDAQGQVLGYELRWNLAEKKEIRFASWCKNSTTRKCQWRMRGLATPRALFNLHILAKHPERPAMFFEGCRKADRASALFPDHICVAIPNGAGGVSKADLVPLHGRPVVIWRDADEPGEAFAYEIGRALRHRSTDVVEVDVERVFRACVAGEDIVPVGWDVVDALATEIDHATLSRVALESLRPLELDVERPDGRTFIKVGNATLTPSQGLIMTIQKAKELIDVWVSGAFEVLGQSRDRIGSDWGVFISWKDSDGREHTECVPRADMVGDARKLATRLVAEGFPLNHGRERLLAQFLMMVKPRARVYIVRRYGFALKNAAANAGGVTARFGSPPRERFDHEGRLIAGVNSLSELSPRLRQAVLLNPDKIAAGATYEDAETLAAYRGLAPRTVGHKDFLAEAMEAGAAGRKCHAFAGVLGEQLDTVTHGTPRSAASCLR